MRPIKHWDRKGLRSFSPYDGMWQSELLLGRTDRWGSGDIHCCMYCHNGDCDWTDWKDVVLQCLEVWEGAESYCANYSGYHGRVKVGLLLDLDEGTLTVYKNGRRLGVMKNGLSGVYSWSIQLYGNHDVAIQRSDLATA